MNKLLFITQKIDKDDSVLGVYHRWLEELARKVEQISVICLYQGRTELPVNVRVFSLGKESNPSRMRYVSRFYKYIWELKGDYKTVFVHMNPIYIVLGGLFWKLNGKKIFLWYNHPMGNFTAKIGIKLADKVFCTSSYSFSAKYRKTSLMPVGIDTDFFRPMSEISKNNKQILYLGRISPIKKIEYLIEAAKILDNQGLDFEVLIIGSPVSPEDKKYESKLKAMSADLISKSMIEFRPAVPNHETPGVYNGSGIFVNLTPTGSFDKTILESMACGTPILVSNKAVEAIIPKEYKNTVIFKEGDASDLATKLISYLKVTNNEKIGLDGLMRDLVLEQHSLSRLINKLI